MADPEPSCRLISHRLNRDAAPAVELAALYHRRGSIEQSLDEFKVHLAARDVVLRSKRPGRRGLVVHSCGARLRRRLPLSAAIPPPEQHSSWFDSVLREIAAGRAVTRRGKRNPRGVKREMSNFPLRKRGNPFNQTFKPSP
jgi:hypothetical protein